MAAFCGCCGAEITEKDEACVICGMPRHGMLRPDGRGPLDPGDEAGQDGLPRLKAWANRAEAPEAE
ncbi:MAG TPA: hypothetical protein VL990_08240 [Acidobacteriaceae bacterium]|nr:hypothetical protein [Acidobacteriaceae bacterium]